MKYIVIMLNLIVMGIFGKGFSTSIIVCDSRLPLYTIMILTKLMDFFDCWHPPRIWSYTHWYSEPIVFSSIIELRRLSIFANHHSFTTSISTSIGHHFYFHILHISHSVNLRYTFHLANVIISMVRTYISQTPSVFIWVFAWLKLLS